MHWDLFCGIGGFSRALGDVCTTNLYCDSGPACKATIMGNMARGMLCYGAFVDSIMDLVEATPPGVPPPDLITAGFPCQDVSLMGKRAGLDGARSGLVFPLMDVIARTLPPYILLENLPSIRKAKVERVFHRLSEIGYDCAWDTFTAREVGASHLRCRWFCMAVRKGCAPPAVPHVEHTVLSDTPTPTRLCPPPMSRVMSSLECLGNSVVPQCVRLAFHCLAEMHARARADAPLGEARAGSLGEACGEPPRTGTCIGGEVCRARRYRPMGMTLKAAPHGLIIRPRVMESDRPDVKPITTDIARSFWGTPTRMGWGRPKVLTARTANMLAVQMRMEVGSNWNGRDVPNPAWVEWLMGYPPGWITPVP